MPRTICKRLTNDVRLSRLNRTTLKGCLRQKTSKMSIAKPKNFFSEECLLDLPRRWKTMALQAIPNRSSPNTFNEKRSFWSTRSSKSSSMVWRGSQQWCQRIRPSAKRAKTIQRCRLHWVTHFLWKTPWHQPSGSLCLLRASSSCFA